MLPPAFFCFLLLPGMSRAAFGSPDLEQKLVISPGYSVHQAPIVNDGKPLEVKFAMKLIQEEQQNMQIKIFPGTCLKITG